MSNYKINENNTFHTKGESYYAIIQNPTVNYYDTKVLYGSTPQIVQKKIDRQLKKWVEAAL